MSLTGPERSYPRARVNSTYLICIDRESTTLMALLFFFSSFSSITPTGVLSTLYHVICVFNHIFDKYSTIISRRGMKLDASHGLDLQKRVLHGARHLDTVNAASQR
jgi:hypothetical protein